MVDKSSAPAFSMGSPRQKVTLSNELAPGPGAYDSISYLQASKQGGSPPKNSGRFKQYGTFVPGPGTYGDSNKGHIQSALVMSRTKEIQPSSSQAPGPGSYEPNYRKISKNESGFTIGASAKIGDIVGDNRKLPGPGNYETNSSSVTKSRSTKIGNQLRSDMVLNHFTPGPGQYQSRRVEQLTARKEPNAVFGKSGRSHSTTNIVPGPGTYAVTERDFAKSKGFSLSAKHQEIPAFTTKVPGPGAYNTLQNEVLRQKGASFSMGKGAKLVMEHEKQSLKKPGPERYNITQGAFDSKGNMIGRSQRQSLADERNIPGPGSYNFKAQSTLPQFSIPKSQTGWIKSSANPGPGTYQSRIQANSNQVSMKQDPRRPYYDEKKGVPGPGSYNSASTLEKSIKFSIGHQKRPDMGRASNNPGPNNYSIPTTVSNIPKYSH